MRKIFIVKLGYSETLDSRLSLTTSLGDVLRTTVVLHYFKNDQVDWLADKKAIPLLENNPYIKRIFSYNKGVCRQLKKESYDLVVNLEKSPEACAFCGSLPARERVGFKGPSPDSNAGLELSRQARRENKDCWQKVLSWALGKQWKGEPYVLGYQPKSKIKYDIGFNWTTSSKWSNKAWPKDYWDKLETMLKGGYSVSWQKGLRGLYHYMEWINSCRLIVTADTLGLHLALALKKRVVALFGPTAPAEIYFYGLGSFLVPKAPYACLPCLKPLCDKKRQCMEYILPEDVARKVEKEIKNG